MTRLTLRHQRGATLIVALIMLVLLTLFALSAMNASNTALKIASNTQTRSEAIAAVQQEINKVMSVNFTRSPAAIAAAAGNKPVDINNDGAVDYNVVIATPHCMGAFPIRNAELGYSAADNRCRISGASMSLCANSQWDIGGSATDPVSGASVSIHQGVAVRVLTASATVAGGPCAPTP